MTWKAWLSEFVVSFFEVRLKIRLPLNAKLRWKLAQYSEIRFWKKYLQGGGLNWKNKFALKFDPCLPLQEEIYSVLPANKQDIRILDVGAGPMTYLGKVHDGLRIQIEAVDPLADSYNRILDKNKIVPIVKTKQCPAEELSNYFSEDSFDLVFARNCIDHSYNPHVAINEMIKVLHSDCYLVMAHIPNEGKNENYYGLHQWNFDAIDGDFIISSRNEHVNVTKKLKGVCVITCKTIVIDNVEWLYTYFLKQPSNDDTIVL